jgi:hypothetical protein
LLAFVISKPFGDQYDYRDYILDERTRAMGKLRFIKGNSPQKATVLQASVYRRDPGSRPPCGLAARQL